jgi:hypothetical protein
VPFALVSRPAIMRAGFRTALVRKDVRLRMDRLVAQATASENAGVLGIDAGR